MGVLRNTIKETMAKVPHIALHKLLVRKLQESGVAMPDEAVADFVVHILEKKDGKFVWDGGQGRDIRLKITSEDEAEVSAAIDKMVEAIPGAVKEASRFASERMFNRLRDDWPMHRAFDQYEVDEFREGMEERWGEGLDYLRMLLTCCREIGHETYRRHRRSKAKSFRFRRWVMVRLHTRSCQVADEIICLMENGFANGALARWRTLHEISVVATLVTDGDEDLAERYILHDAIERKRQADDYETSQVPLGFAPVGKRDRRGIDANFNALVARFGPEFARPYGWAARHLGIPQPTFKHLQTAANRTGLSTQYKLASFNVHAGSRAMFHDLSTMGDEDLLLTGRSNVGLVEPGELTAQALLLVTGLFSGDTIDLDRLSKLNSLVLIRDAVTPALVRAENRIARDERKRRKIARDRRAARKSAKRE